MGILSESSTGAEKIGKHLQRYSSILSFLFYISGIIYFCFVLSPSFSNKTYFSENALLPGLVDEEFNYAHEIKDQLSILKVLSKPKDNTGYYMPHQRLKETLISFGLETYAQNFTLKYPLAVSEKLEGNNIYGIVRSPRGSSSEAIVVAVSYTMDSLPAIAILLALAKSCREQIYWAKDIIFVIAEHGEVGMLAWLNAYHEKLNEYVLYENLVARGGAIQAAMILDASDEVYSQADIKFNMLDGQLPNLDLVNLAVRMVEKENLIPTIFKQEEHWSTFSSDAYIQFAKTAAIGIVNQASGRVEGSHSVFGGFGIEAVMIQPTKQKGRQNYAGTFEIARVFEGMLRSVNNLLERFHQSFFFYVLSSPHYFISIGLYMPAIGLMLLAPLIKACTLWLQSNEAVEAVADGTVKEGENDAKKDNSLLQKDNSLLAVAPSILLSHLLGVLVRLLPVYVRLLSSPKSSPDNNFMATSLGLTVALLYFPRMLIKKHKLEAKPPSPVLLRCLALLELSTIVGVTSVLNFGLGFLLCLTWIPICTLITPMKSNVGWFLKSFLLVLINPLILIFVVNLIYIISTDWTPAFGIVWLIHGAYDATKTTILTTVLDSYIYGSWQFSLIAIGLIPVWTLFWTLLSM